ncbi:MAG: DNA glycosylase AlkZ-like family protein, partial [Candidatus Limnocylindria bacterium]
MAGTSLDPSQARRLAIHAQALDGTARDVLDVVRRLGRIQIDPTSRVAPSQLLVLWSRLGPYDPSDLDRLLWHERALFENSAFIFPVEDFPLVQARMRGFPRGETAWPRRVRAWLEVNAAFRRYVLRELERRGPLRSDELEDRSVEPWRSTGWTHDRNVTQMLEFLSAQGRLLVARRERSRRFWDLAERVLPAAVVRARPLGEREAARRIAER